MTQPGSSSKAAGSAISSWIEQPDPRQLLSEQDPEIYAAIESERHRQTYGIELIASENYVFPEVLAAAGSVLTNKYAEGYPGRRYYGGCQYVDVAEKIGLERALELFGAEHANVQPHSGAQANAAVYMALLEPGDTVLAMKLDHGGHLSHGFHLNSSGHYYNFVHYGLNPETEQLDYEVMRQTALDQRPKLLLVGASAYPRHFDFRLLREIADEAGCLLMMDMAHVAGLVAAKLHPDPVPYCDVVTTTTHKTLRGPRGGLILCRQKHARSIDRAVFPGIQGGPLMHIIAAKAVGFKLAQGESFRMYQQQILDNAQALSDTLQAQGLRSVSGGTDNHLLLVDLNPLNNEETTGKLLETALDNASIHCNKNMIPFDKRKAMVTSGIRLGTPAATTRGMQQVEFEQIGRWIASIAHDPKDTALQESVRDEVLEMVQAFPVPA
ncbi:MAG: serine hydroxymethyltransferase [Caldilineaceae bacterium SB0670_bin_27]|uniref:Serine hydroxymethyltransferase n=1 Tax=Caldilineaceae bacterium SB0664_bin_27 TaxID=2605260 RepID=A0A6B0YW96_9CHLR|nr:serine hydroxymethyltransferase [Caldilineaceae bacterium SB0664_bin_27]MYJ77766.1 serine hydroxymethyltransferase [Caldilineaceae bacterium SB0670_bin_27]